MAFVADGRDGSGLGRARQMGDHFLDHSGSIVIEQITYVMSSTYSGSTILSAILGSSPNSYFLGEPALIFRKTGSGQWRHQSFCTTCNSQPVSVECPVWGRAVIHALRARPELYFDILNRRLPPEATRLVDSSKSLWWIEAGLAHRIEARVLHITKPVESFLGSLVNRAKAKFNLGYCARHWADENLRIFEYCQARQIKYLHIDYNEFCNHPERTLAGVGEWLGGGPIAEEPQWDRPPHYIKGNPGTATHFTTVQRTEDLVGLNAELYRTGHRRIFLDEKWRSLISPAYVRAVYEMGCVRAANDTFGYHCPSLKGDSEKSRSTSASLAVGAAAYGLSRPLSKWKRRGEFEKLPDRDSVYS